MTEDELAELERFCAATLPDNRGMRYFAEEVVPALVAEVRRLRDEREALVWMVEGGFQSGRCPCCRPTSRGTELFAHDDDCPLREGGRRLDVAGYTAYHRRVMAEGEAFRLQWEAEHPQLAEELRRRAAELAQP